MRLSWQLLSQNSSSRVYTSRPKGLHCYSRQISQALREQWSSILSISCDYRGYISRVLYCCNHVKPFEALSQHLFWRDITPFGLLKFLRRCRGTFIKQRPLATCFVVESSLSYYSHLKTEGTYLLGTSVDYQRTTTFRIPKYAALYLYLSFSPCNYWTKHSDPQ
jgi:hypothetical protein